MKTVRRLEPETVIESVTLADGRVAGLKSPLSQTWAVIDEAGNVAKTANALTGKPQHEIYPTKKAAERVAAFLSR